MRPPHRGADATAWRRGNTRLLFSATHDLQSRPDNKKKLSQAKFQGALVCQRPTRRGEAYVAGKHIDKDANLHGLIAFFFACFSAGTPKEDAYNRLLRMRQWSGAGSGSGADTTSHFVSYLPQRLLTRRPGLRRAGRHRTHRASVA